MCIYIKSVMNYEVVRQEVYKALDFICLALRDPHVDTLINRNGNKHIMVT